RSPSPRKLEDEAGHSLYELVQCGAPWRDRRDKTHGRPSRPPLGNRTVTIATARETRRLSGNSDRCGIAFDTCGGSSCNTVGCLYGDVLAGEGPRTSRPLLLAADRVQRFAFGAVVLDGNDLADAESHH